MSLVFRQETGQGHSQWSAPLPGVTNIAYTSVNEAGDITFALSSLITTPRSRLEAQPSYGAYKRALTTFKIDPSVWAAASALQMLSLTAGPGAVGLYVNTGSSIYSGPGDYSITAGGGIWYLRYMGTPVDQTTGSSVLGPWTSGTVVADIALYPKLRDYFTVSNTTWTVHRDVDSPSPAMGLWRLSCVSLSIDPALADTVTITLPADFTDASSSPLTTTGATANYTARIQFVSEATEDYQGVQFMRSYFRIFVAGLNGTAANLPLGTTLTCTAGEYTGVTFRVLDNANIDSLDELPVYTCTVDP